MGNDMLFKGGGVLFPPLIQTGYTARPQNTSRDFLRDNALTKSSAFKYERYIPLQPEGTGFVSSGLNTKLGGF